MSFLSKIVGIGTDYLGFGKDNLLTQGIDSVSDAVMPDTSKGGGSNFITSLLTTGASFLSGAAEIKAQDKALKSKEESENMDLLLKLAELKYGQGGGGGSGGANQLAAAYGQAGKSMGEGYASLGQTLGGIYK